MRHRLQAAQRALDRALEGPVRVQEEVHPEAHFAQALRAALLPQNAAQGAQAQQEHLERRQAQQGGQGRPAERPERLEPGAEEKQTASGRGSIARRTQCAQR